MINDNDTVFVIVADCGGGDDRNPHLTLESAKARVAKETGVEIWQTTFADYQNNERGGLDYPDLSTAVCVFER